MRAGLALIVLVLNIIAIVSILGTRRAASSKLGWTAAVVLLPLAGALGWLALGRARSRRG
ncbi:MAG TPA: PLD nuclease N-terminal domain-containing protein [Longimicrobiales bacterium]